MKQPFHRRFFPRRTLRTQAAEHEAREKRLFSHLPNPIPLRASGQYISRGLWRVCEQAKEKKYFH